jgi:hypothetical protein
MEKRGLNDFAGRHEAQGICIDSDGCCGFVAGAMSDKGSD